jgi:hypothetical protein
MGRPRIIAIATRNHCRPLRVSVYDANSDHVPLATRDSSSTDRDSVADRQVNVSQKGILAFGKVITN